jgi:hypothetical protein
MAQVQKRERSRWLVIWRSSSKPKRDEVVARMPEVDWEVAQNVCLQKYGARSTLLPWSLASPMQRRAAELLPVTYIPMPGQGRDYARLRNTLVSGAGGRS